MSEPGMGCIGERQICKGKLFDVIQSLDKRLKEEPGQFLINTSCAPHWILEKRRLLPAIA
jgi:hypothetical protein